jgi:hypothetical protein
MFYPAERILLATARLFHRPIGRSDDQLASFLGGPVSQGDEILLRTTDQIFAGQTGRSTRHRIYSADRVTEQIPVFF